MRLHRCRKPACGRANRWAVQRRSHPAGPTSPLWQVGKDSRHPRADPTRKLSLGVPDRRQHRVDTDTGSYGPSVAACARLLRPAL